MAELKQWHLVCYDIRDPKRWRMAFKLLKGYGHAIQYSILQCRLNKRQLEQLRWELEKVLTVDDSLLITSLCQSCASKVVTKKSGLSFSNDDSAYVVY